MRPTTVFDGQHDFLHQWCSTWEHILRFLQPHEVVRVTCLNQTFYTAMKEDFHFQYTNEVILTVPWNLCETETRRRWFRRFQNLRCLRLDPSFSSSCVADDMYYLLQGSTKTLTHLYVCTSDLLHPTVRRDASVMEDSYERHLRRLQPLIGCPHYDTCSPAINLLNEPLKFQSLVHLELSGNDAQLWALFFVKCRLEKLQTITLQTWTNDLVELCLDQQALPLVVGKQARPSFYHEAHDHSLYDLKINRRHTRRSLSVSANLNLSVHKRNGVRTLDRKKDAQNFTERNGNKVFETKEVSGRYYWSRNLNCLRRGLCGLILLIDSVRETLCNVEFILAGKEADRYIYSLFGAESFLSFSTYLPRETVKVLSHFFQNSTDETTRLDGLSPPESVKKFFQHFQLSPDTLVSPQPDKKFSIVRQELCEWFGVQFEGCVELLQHLIFSWNAFHQLSVIRFLGFTGINSGLSTLIGTLSQYYAVSCLSNSLAFLRSKTNGPEDQRMHSNGLHFKNNWRLNACRSSMFSGLNYNPSTMASKILEQHESHEDHISLPFPIIFSAPWDLPRKTFIDLDILYPEFVLQSVGQTSRNPYGPLHSLSAQHGKIDNRNQNEQMVIRIRLDKQLNAKPIREFQRLRQHTASFQTQKYLWPHHGSSLRVFFNPNNFLSSCSSSVVVLKIKFSSYKDEFRKFEPMSFKSLKILELINWTGNENPSNVQFLDLTCTQPPQHIQLIIRMKKRSRHFSYFINPKRFFQNVRSFIDDISLRGLLVERLSLIPCPDEHQQPYLCYLFPIKKLILTIPPTTEKESENKATPLRPSMIHRNTCQTSRPTDRYRNLTLCLDTRHVKLNQRRQDVKNHFGRVSQQTDDSQVTVKINQHVLTFSTWQQQNKYEGFRDLSAKLCEIRFHLKKKQQEKQSQDDASVKNGVGHHANADLETYNLSRLCPKSPVWKNHCSFISFSDERTLDQDNYCVVTLRSPEQECNFAEYFDMVDGLLNGIITPRPFFIVDCELSLPSNVWNGVRELNDLVFWMFKNVFLYGLGLFNIEQKKDQSTVRMIRSTVQLDSPVSFQDVPSQQALRFQGYGVEVVNTCHGETQSEEKRTMVLSLDHPTQWSVSLGVWLLMTFSHQLPKAYIVWLKDKKYQRSFDI